MLVGNAAAALYAGHRASFDHDHVLADLNERFEAVLEAVESTDGWVTNRVVPYKLILGDLGDIEAGVRQLIRRRPLEVTEVQLPSGQRLRVPTLAEILRIKGYLIVSRNQTRDYIDVAALADTLGLDGAAATLATMDEFYGDQRQHGLGVASQLQRQLAEPRPKDSHTTLELSRYRRLEPKWQDWRTVVASNQDLAVRMLDVGVETGSGHTEAPP